MQPLAFFIFAEIYRCENGWSTTPRFISFPLRAFWSMILWRKRPERKDEVHEFSVWNVHEAHGRSTAVGRNAPSHTQTIILQVIYRKRFRASYNKVSFGGTCSWCHHPGCMTKSHFGGNHLWVIKLFWESPTHVEEKMSSYVVWNEELELGKETWNWVDVVCWQRIIAMAMWGRERERVMVLERKVVI